MTASERVAQARLTAVAVVRAMLTDDDKAVSALLSLDDDPLATAHAACGLAASLLYGLPADATARILAGLTDAALAEGSE